MDDMNFNNRLQYYSHSLSKSELKIAEYIKSHIAEASIMPSMELAKIIGTSTSTITRFCQKLNYRNFIEFQTLLSSENSVKHEPLKDFLRIAYYYEKLLKSSAELLSRDSLDEFIKRIANSDQILIFGIGSSGLTAQELNIRLVQMGISSTAITDSHLMLVQASLFSPRDLIICISNSGETREVVVACKVAKRAGTPICSITHNPQSTVAKLSNTILLTSSCEEQINDNKFINSQLPLLFLIDAITYILLENPHYSNNYQKSRQALAIR